MRVMSDVTDPVGRLHTMSETPLDGYNAPPRLGQHTPEALTELLGHTAADVDALESAGVVQRLNGLLQRRNR